jgi:solute carrier family 25, member 33/36
MASGVAAGVTTSTLTNPIWVVKTRLQLDKSGTRKYKNSLDCLVQIWRYEGVKGFGRGLSASYLGVTETTLQWVLYDRLKHTLKTDGSRKQQSFGDKLREALGAGFLAKTIATVVTYPHEVRARLGGNVVDIFFF